MSKHENILQFQESTAAPVVELETIGAIFTEWTRVSEIVFDTSAPQCSRDRARERLNMLWDMAEDHSASEAHEVAALYIMANNTPDIEPERYMQRAWNIAHSGASEAELIRLYGLWRSMIAVYEGPGFDENAGQQIYDLICDIERQMVAIPATSARGLAIKVDLGRFDNSGILADALAAELAAWTGFNTRPEIQP